jgi:hypothetical protein
VRYATGGFGLADAALAETATVKFRCQAELELLQVEQRAV